MSPALNQTPWLIVEDNTCDRSSNPEGTRVTHSQAETTSHRGAPVTSPTQGEGSTDNLRVQVGLNNCLFLRIQLRLHRLCLDLSPRYTHLARKVDTRIVIGGFPSHFSGLFGPTSYHTVPALFAKGRDVRHSDGRPVMLEFPVSWSSNWTSSILRYPTNGAEDLALPGAPLRRDQLPRNLLMVSLPT